MPSLSLRPDPLSCNQRRKHSYKSHTQMVKDKNTTEPLHPENKDNCWRISLILSKVKTSIYYNFMITQTVLKTLHICNRATRLKTLVTVQAVFGFPGWYQANISLQLHGSALKVGYTQSIWYPNNTAGGKHYAAAKTSEIQVGLHFC